MRPSLVYKKPEPTKEDLHRQLEELTKSFEVNKTWLQETFPKCPAMKQGLASMLVSELKLHLFSFGTLLAQSVQPETQPDYSDLLKKLKFVNEIILTIALAKEVDNLKALIPSQWKSEDLSSQLELFDEEYVYQALDKISKDLHTDSLLERVELLKPAERKLAQIKASYADIIADFKLAASKQSSTSKSQASDEPEKLVDRPCTVEHCDECDFFKMLDDISTKLVSAQSTPSHPQSMLFVQPQWPREQNTKPPEHKPSGCVPS